MPVCPFPCLHILVKPDRAVDKHMCEFIEKNNSKSTNVDCSRGTLLLGWHQKRRTKTNMEGIQKSVKTEKGWKVHEYTEGMQRKCVTIRLDELFWSVEMESNVLPV